ncbi:type II and III secretion system protein family protein [Ferruginivarius sediminum]|uniref:Type II and III secretion system protein family protein n=1 Tax=Ferruginivarius sediminum TaxID=2661937 RepID=A0A369TBN9_9PROT|nr:type II and III secretion system protein family protein [Ferruginivarius sediminum]RDD62690.1 type II and III secretion system protein family protein [Ferruginivarius sediminum]
MMRRISLICLTVLAVLVAAPAARALDVVGTGDQTVELERNKGVLVRLQRNLASVFVADPEVADVQVKSPKLVYVFGKKVGETTLFAVDGNDNVVVSERVRVRHNLTGLRDALSSIDPAQPIEVEAVNGALVLRGTVPSAEAAENARRIALQFAEEGNIINRLQVTGPTQVNIRVRVAEVSRTLSKDFGVRWQNLTADLGGGDILSFAGGSLTGQIGSYATLFDINNGDFSTETILDVLSQEGLVSILAEPNLTAMSGEQAAFLAGGEFPIPVDQDDDGITVEFKEFGVRLAITPVILGDGRISLAVAPEVSELNFTDGVALGTSGIRIPALNTRRVSTTVELASGQSFAIAGLLQKTSSHDIDRLPGLGDLPVLGALFRSDSFQQGETELAIIVTPYIVEPTSSKEMALPTDGLTPPNDMERILFGRMYGESSAKRLAAEEKLGGRKLAGPVGFMLE